ncbi:MAG: hypothetical protein K2H25_00985, partial [Alistipes sp.]|nr:hypothetical protein [Alistipes sp.]
MKTYDNDKKEVKTGRKSTTATAKTKTAVGTKTTAPAKKKSRYTGDAQSDFHTFFVDELKD